MIKTAYDATSAILDINETIEALKAKNADKTPDFALCKATDLLTDYRIILTDTLRHTELQFGAKTDNYID